MLGAAGACITASKATAAPVAPVFTGDTKVYSAATITMRDIASDGSTMVSFEGGAGNAVIYSNNNGSTWNACTITNTGVNLAKLVYENSLWLMIGSDSGGGRVFTSSNGITWTSRLDTATAGHTFNYVKWSTVHSLWIICGNDGVGNPICYTASDATGTWTSRSLPDPLNYSDDAYTVVENTLNNNVFIIGEGLNTSFSSVESYYWTTTNGTTWATETQGNLNQIEGPPIEMTYVPAEDVFFCWQTSNDLDYWTNSAGVPGVQNTVDDAAANSPALGRIKLNDAGGLLIAYGGTTGVSSSDGTTVNNRYAVAAGVGDIEAVIQHGTRYFCCGFDGTNGAIYELTL